MAEAEDVFGLNGQIEHKLSFLLEHVPRDTHLILIGHSIGCYIILEMMKRDPELKVKSYTKKHVFVLFCLMYIHVFTVRCTVVILFNSNFNFDLYLLILGEIS